MKICYKLRPVILFFICLVFSSQIIFAQNANDLKAEIYSKLDCCPCPKSFAECTCPEARKMKVYIDALLESGITRDEIFYKVAKKFSPKVIVDKQIKAQVEWLLAREAGIERPQLIIEPISFDFGKVSRKQGKIKKIFKLHNKGASLLIISNIKASCGCVAASLKVGKSKSPYFGTDGAPKGWQIGINPNETGELEFVLDLHHRSVKIGPLLRGTTIFSNDPIYPEIFVKIEAEVLD